MLFQSTPPVKAATPKPLTFDVASVFQSTPPVKAATYGDPIYYEGNYISIHAAREGGDLILIILNLSDRISIHAAREGGD